MAIVDISELAAAAGPGGRLAGLDVGSKTIGVAVSDGARRVASPVGTIRRTKFTQDAQKLIALMTDRDVKGLVVGLPINMDGSEGPRVQSVRQFAQNLLEKIDLPLAFWDERLSTVAVTRSMLEADLSRKRRAEEVDKLAAAYILQGAIDFMSR